MDKDWKCLKNCLHSRPKNINKLEKWFTKEHVHDIDHDTIGIQQFLFGKQNNTSV